MFPMVFLVQPVADVEVIPPERLAEWERMTMEFLRTQVREIRDRAVVIPDDDGGADPNTGTCTGTISGDPRKVDDPDYD
ncbi:hypothetical protein EDD30_6649 [Couchioplanes caeruleus]|uniref:Uncharacterized protein n=2 Tax=Couchioplanes caeruleus TaxID=56438 RepID=A0A1K0GL11_9ACTN|nr:hypothetical protein BG844_17560 [Couchioplanes caeruleus subsp. caeruleus]ROP33632.1 hypothetical protein EDD30_6649 [Couchioplanes caeruleus]